MFNKRKIHKRLAENGYIALFSMMIVSSIVVFLAMSLNLISIDEADSSLKNMQSKESLYLATACAEEALIKLKESLDYSGQETISFSTGSCQILSLIGEGNEDRIVMTTGIVYNIERHIRIEVSQVNPEMTISSWQEVEGF